MPNQPHRSDVGLFLSSGAALEAGPVSETIATSHRTNCTSFIQTTKMI